MNADNKTPADDTQNTADASRRRALIKAGLAAAPLMATLKAQSAFATGSTHNCVHISAFASLARANMQLSRTVDSSGTCYSHGYWKNHGSSTQKAAIFLTPVLQSSCASTPTAGFAAVSPKTDVLACKTLQQVLSMSGNSDKVVALARHTVGMYLTALNFPGDALYDETEVKAMWYGLVGAGSWQPAGSSIPLSLDQTMAYFNYIFDGTTPPAGMF
ncbi:hypothetical protein [Denitromonas sp.]|uniref:hypothetical protein n=1 Tax=Denitromonas sp. TaxID=2734609 RepID=UPI002AFE4CEA|nr:hypothetical protein [Denitromonas sp.]